MEPEDPIPNPETVAKAVGVLQAQLGMVQGAIDALDRKASLVPPFLVAVAAFLLGPVGTSYNPGQLLFVGLAVLTGIAASWCAYKAMAPDVIQLGPKARIVEDNVGADPAKFDQRVVQSLAEAVQLTSMTTMTKGRRLTWGLKLAGITMLLLVLARIAGGLPMAENSESAPVQPSQAAPSAEPTVAATTAAPTSVPASAPATAEPSASLASPAADASPPANELPSFGQQLATASEAPPGLMSFEQQTAVRSQNDLPSFEQQLAAKGGQVPEAAKEIIEKGD